MVLGTSSRKRKRSGTLAVDDMATFARKLREHPSGVPVPLLVVRLRDLERIAWREGRAAARVVERRSLRSFVETASRALRSTDLLAHDDDSEDFLAALISPTRSTGAVAAPADCRATLARLASAMQPGGGMRVETGWTMLGTLGADTRLSESIESALERGARERERYAFFSTVGHELRTPLTSIRGYLETVLEEDLDPATARRFLEIARTEAMRLGRLVESMFDISMLDLRSGSEVDESCDLGSAIVSARSTVASTAAACRTVITETPCEPIELAIGADRLLQILINLLENAIKHGREGGRVHVSAGRLDERYAEIRIDDDGPGVAESERESVFSLAMRGNNARGAGSGIGLAVVRLLVERIGGEVDVAESPLGGAQFRIRLPFVHDITTTERVAAIGSDRAISR
jgi:signal transduction histidine kinase